MELIDTIDKMTSTDYSDRLIAEAQQLQIRMDKLGTMLIKHARGELDFTPKCPIKLLEAQHRTMNAYYSLLMARAEIEGVELKLEV